MKLKLFISMVALSTILFSCSKNTEPTPEPTPPVVPPTTKLVVKITDFLPLSAKQNEEITINGENFGTNVDATTIQFGDAPAIKPKTVLNKKITVMVPSNAVTGQLKVTNATGTASSPMTWTYIPATTNPGGPTTPPTGYTHTITKGIMKSGYFIISADQTKVLSTGFSNISTGLGLETDQGTEFGSEYAGTGAVYKTELVHAEKAIITLSTKKLELKFPIIAGDTTTMTYMRYTNKNDVTKKIDEYRLYMEDNTSRIVLLTIKDDFPANADVTFVTNKLATSPQKLIQSRVKLE